ncbi:MAG: phosphoribosylglycinamide formyltransferase [Pseudohongiellaceae bacterium]
MKPHCTVVVLISGNGTNLQALIDASLSSNFKIVAVFSNNPDAYGLTRAQRDDIPAIVVNHRNFKDRQSFDQALLQQTEKFQPDLVVLAGFMRILGESFVQHYVGRILNIHPSLLPNYPGINTHQRVLDAGDQIHGVSVHFVDEDLDGGPIVAHAKVDVLAVDTAETLAARVLTKEHLIYPHVVSWFAAGRLKLQAGKAWLDGQPLPPAGLEME